MEIEDRVRGYACDAVGDCALERAPTVTRFDAGDRHAVYKVSYLNEAGHTRDLVVRVSTRRGAEACDEAKLEAAVIVKAQGVAAPLLYDVRCSSRWFDTPAMCMQFVAGQHRDLLTRSPLEDLEHFGSLLARVHQLSIDDLPELQPTSGTIAGYLDERHRAIVATIGPLRELLPAQARHRVERASSAVNERLEAARTTASFKTDESLVLWPCALNLGSTGV